MKMIIRCVRRTANSKARSWAVLRGEPDKRDAAVAYLPGNDPFTRLMVVKTAIAFMLELGIEDLSIEPCDWAEEMAGYAAHLNDVMNGRTMVAQ